MELPIRVIIVLFVALVVGTTIIGFAKNIISDSEEKIRGIGDDGPDGTQALVEVQKITAGTVLNLAEECYQNKKGEVLTKTLCFVVRSDQPIGISEVTKIQASSYAVTNIIGEESIFIYYQPTIGNVNITG